MKRTKQITREKIEVVLDYVGGYWDGADPESPEFLRILKRLEVSIHGRIRNDRSVDGNLIIKSRHQWEIIKDKDVQPWGLTIMDLFDFFAALKSGQVEKILADDNGIDRLDIQ